MAKNPQKTDKKCAFQHKYAPKMAYIMPGGDTFAEPVSLQKLNKI